MSIPQVPVTPDDPYGRVWHKKDIYTGPDGTGPIVPNVDDFVIDPAQGVMLVTAVDNSSKLSTIVPWPVLNLRGGVKNQDKLLANGPGCHSQAYKAFVDTRTTPHTLAIDSRLSFKSVEASYVKIFRGVDITSTGQVISAVMDNSNNVVSENVQLDLIANNRFDNYAWKSPKHCNITETLADNDQITVVAYANSGKPVSVYTLNVVVTNFITTIDQQKKYVTAIRLRSPYLSASDNTLLEVPLNLTVSSMNLLGEVTYNDGSTAVFPVSGAKFSLLGANRYVSTALGQTVPILLQYKMSNDEYSVHIGPSVPNSRIVHKPYRLKTIQSESQYSVKIFVIPKWKAGTTSTWELEYYLYNLKRDVVHKLDSSHVEFASQTNSFDGSNYDDTQTLTIAYNLNNLGGSYNYYRHVQVVSIKLDNQGTNYSAETYYKIGYEGERDFGNALYATSTPDPVNVSKFKLDISTGATTLNQWLNKVYDPIYPLVLTPIETIPPVPSHVRLIVGAWSKEIPVGDALSEITNVGATITQGSTVELEFFRGTGSNKIELGKMGLVIRAL